MCQCNALSVSSTPHSPSRSMTTQQNKIEEALTLYKRVLTVQAKASADEPPTAEHVTPPFSLCSVVSLGYGAVASVGIGTSEHGPAVSPTQSRRTSKGESFGMRCPLNNLSGKFRPECRVLASASGMGRYRGCRATCDCVFLDQRAIWPRSSLGVRTLRCITAFISALSGCSRRLASEDLLCSFSKPHSEN